MKTLKELQALQRECIEKQGNINDAAMNEKRELTATEKAEYDMLTAKFETAAREITALNQQAEAAKFARENTPAKSKNQVLREYVTAVREHKVSGEIKLRTNSQDIVSSAVVATGDVNNITSAGLPTMNKDLVNPLEMGTIYELLGIPVATNVHGQIQWPVLDTVAKVTVAGETAKLSATSLDFSKIVATPVRLGISIEVDNEAISDASFDLVGAVNTQINKALGRVINEAVLSPTKFNAKFYGPMATAKTKSVTFATAGNPTYAELLEMKGKVMATGAQMAGFCYVMDAAMYAKLEAKAKEAGAGLFIIENGKINGVPVFVTDIAAYAGKVAAGCFGYAALNQHGDAKFIIDPYSLADRNAVKFTLNADWSLTTLQGTAFVVGA